MTPDKKVEEYLERAMLISNLNDKYEGIWTEGALSRVVEIAKMIQLEEHRERLNPVGLLGSGEVYKLSRE